MLDRSLMEPLLTCFSPVQPCQAPAVRAMGKYCQTSANRFSSIKMFGLFTWSGEVNKTGPPRQQKEGCETVYGKVLLLLLLLSSWRLISDSSVSKYLIWCNEICFISLNIDLRTGDGVGGERELFIGMYPVMDCEWSIVTPAPVLISGPLLATTDVNIFTAMGQIVREAPRW